MKILLLLSLVAITFEGYAQKPKVSKATKSDTSSYIRGYKAITPKNRWENGEVKNFFLYNKVKKMDTLRIDSLRAKQNNEIKREQ